MYCSLLLLKLVVAYPTPLASVDKFHIPVAVCDTVPQTDPVPGSSPASDLGGDSSKLIFTFVEKPPSFPGGEAALNKFLIKNIRYPREALADNISGTCYVQFVININGEISNIKIVGARHRYLDEEALRVVGSMPPWNPGFQKNRRVSVQFNLPIRFVSGKEQPTIAVGKLLTEQPDSLSQPGDHPANFAGGQSSLLQFLGNNMKYPKKAIQEKIQGIVMVNFLVDKNGHVTDVMVTSRPLAYLDEEALRVISLLPDWNAAVKQGKFASSGFGLPIHFSLP